MLLGLRTDKPEAELFLCAVDGTVVGSLVWEAHRELARTLLEKIDTFLQAHTVTPAQLSGLFVYQGPGSFTGLRIGLTVANSLAYAQQLPIVGVSGEQWVTSGVQRLAQAENDTVVLPVYGADVRITSPKK